MIDYFKLEKYFIKHVKIIYKFRKINIYWQNTKLLYEQSSWVGTKDIKEILDSEKNTVLLPLENSTIY